MTEDRALCSKGFISGYNQLVFQSRVRSFLEKHTQIIEEAGLTVSNAKWVDNEIGKAYICSVESTPGTYGNPSQEYLYSHETGKVS